MVGGGCCYRAASLLLVDLLAAHLATQHWTLSAVPQTNMSLSFLSVTDTTSAAHDIVAHVHRHTRMPLGWSLTPRLTIWLCAHASFLPHVAALDSPPVASPFIYVLRSRLGITRCAVVASQSFRSRHASSALIELRSCRRHGGHASPAL